MRKSVHNEDDEIRMATAMFDKMKVSHPREDVGKSFRFLQCWELLRDLPNFSAVMYDGSSSAGETNLSQKDTTDDEVKAFKKERPIG